jgi:hypothetical protein
MSDVRWEGLTHDEIYARVQQGPGRAASADAEAAWSTVEGTIRAIDERLTRAVKQIGAGWEGAAAARVEGGVAGLSTWALDAAGDASLTKTGITQQAEQAGYVRTSMPPPRTAEWNETIGQVLAGEGHVPAVNDLGALEDRMADDRARAVELMAGYTRSSGDNRRMMDYWTPPPQVVVDAASAGPPTAAAAGPAPGRTWGSLSPVAGPAITPGGETAPAEAALPGGMHTAPFVPGTGAAPAAEGPGTAAGSARAARPPAPAPPPGGAVDPAGTAAVPGPGRPGRTASTEAAVPSTGAGGTGRSRESVPAAVPGLPVLPRSPGAPPRTATPSAAPGFDRSRPDPLPTTGGVRRVVPGPPRPGAVDGWPGSLVPRPGERGPRGLPEPFPGGTPHARTPVEPTATARTAPGMYPLTGAVGRPADQQHRRPGYLVDDTDAFADDRSVTPAVISGDDEVAHA